MQEALLQLIGTVLGAIISFAGGAFVVYMANINAQKAQAEEARKRQILRAKKIRRQIRLTKISRIERYLEIRTAMIKSFTQPLVHSIRLVEELLPQIWKLGGEGVKAKTNAQILGDEVLVTKLVELDILFQSVWNKIQKGERSPEILATFDQDLDTLYGLITIRLNALKKETEEQYLNDRKTIQTRQNRFPKRPNTNPRNRLEIDERSEVHDVDEMLHVEEPPKAHNSGN